MPSATPGFPMPTCNPTERRASSGLESGAWIVVLEALDQALARRARVRAEIVGFGTSSDGFDMVMPEPSGVQAAQCMRGAIQDAGMSPREVGAVNTHGTATIKGDIAEVEAMRH